MRNHVARDLAGPKFRQRIVPDRKKMYNEDESYYFVDEYEEDE